MNFLNNISLKFYTGYKSFIVGLKTPKSDVRKMLSTYAYSFFVIFIYIAIILSMSAAFKFSDVVTTLLSDLIIIPLCYLFYREFVSKSSDKKFLDKRFSLSTRKFFLIVGCSIVYTYMSLTIGNFISSLDSSVMPAFNNVSDNIWVCLLFYIVIAPVSEEFMYRFCVYNIMRSVSGFIPAMFFSSLLFGASHGNILHAILGTAFGVFLVIIYEQSGRNLFMNIMCHAIYNTIAVFTTVDMTPYTFWIADVAFISIILLGLVYTIYHMYPRFKKNYIIKKFNIDKLV